MNLYSNDFPSRIIHGKQNRKLFQAEKASLTAQIPVFLRVKCFLLTMTQTSGNRAKALDLSMA